MAIVPDIDQIHETEDREHDGGSLKRRYRERHQGHRQHAQSSSETTLRNAGYNNRQRSQHIK
jgi:hypothetical protein